MTTICRLPGPIADLWEWQFDGSCRRGNPEVFFHPDGERGPSRRNRDRAAKAVCLECPVLANCRKHALQVGEPYGVWGGMTEREREATNVPSTGLPTQSHASREVCRDLGAAPSIEALADQKARSTGPCYLARQRIIESGGGSLAARPASATTPTADGGGRRGT